MNAPDATIREAIVSDELAGARVDRALASLLNDVSRSRLQALLQGGAVSLGGRTVSDPSQRVKSGERYIVALPAPTAAEPAPERMALNIVHEDSDLIVIDKPAGLVVHPAAGHASGTLVNALLAHCGDSLSGIGGVRRPGIVHRLDKDTSGLLVVAKSDAAHQGLAEQFRSHGADGRLARRYRAFAWGTPLRRQGTIDAALARSRANRTRIGVSEGPASRHAVTHFQRLTSFPGIDGKIAASLLELTLETGRTHQIRVHLAHIGHPIMGDPVYATGFITAASRLGSTAQTALAALGRQALHAVHLAFEHPISGRALAFDSPFPADMAALYEALQVQPPKPVASAGSPRARRRK